MLGAQHLNQLDKADVLLRRNSREDHAAKCPDPTRARIATLRLGLDGARRVEGLDAPHGAGTGDAKPLSRPAAGHTLFRHSGNKAGT